MSSTTIRKAWISGYGGPEKVSIITAEIPAPAAGHVQVKTICSGMGGADSAMRMGYYPLQRPAPLTPGYSLVGAVLHNGPGCSKFEPGTIVACLTVYDAHAELINLPEKYLIPVPDGVDPKHAVAMVLDWTTAYGLVYRSGKVTKGQRVFIHGMSGAVGNAILHLCKLQGAEIYGTASESNHAALRELGTTPFTYKNKDWIKAMNDIGGAHIIFDPLGYDSFDESWSIKAPEGGHLIGYGGNLHMLNGGTPRSQIPSTIKLLARNLCWAHTASFFWVSRDQSTFEPELRTLFDMCRRGDVKVPIKKEWSLEEYPEAHRMWKKSYGCGSVVINVAEDL